jgi:hypothetical protein
LLQITLRHILGHYDLDFITLKPIDNPHVRSIVKSIEVNNMQLYFICSNSSSDCDSGNLVETFRLRFGDNIKMDLECMAE